MTSFFGASSGRLRNSCSSVNTHVITSLWECSTAFCCFVSGFADLTAQNNKTDGRSDFIGQEQRVKVNRGDNAARQGREINSWDDVQRRTPGWVGDVLPESLVWWKVEACNEDRKVSKHNTRNGAMKQGKNLPLKEQCLSESSTYDLLNRENTFTSIQAAMPLSRTGHGLTHEVAPAGSGCPGQHPEKGSAGRQERIFQVSPV